MPLAVDKSVLYDDAYYRRLRRYSYRHVAPGCLPKRCLAMDGGRGMWDIGSDCTDGWLGAGQASVSRSFLEIWIIVRESGYG